MKIHRALLISSLICLVASNASAMQKSTATNKKEVKSTKKRGKSKNKKPESISLPPQEKTSTIKESEQIKNVNVGVASIKQPVVNSPKAKPQIILPTAALSKAILPQENPVKNVEKDASLTLQLKNNYPITARALDSKAIDEIERIIGYHFKNKDLLKQALTTRAQDRKTNYERYELLGDKVLGLIITELLMQEYSNEQEGSLSSARDALVSKEPLAALCLRLGLHNYIQKKQEPLTISNLEDVIEALIGVLYEDGGADAAQSFVLKFFIPFIKDKACPAMAIDIIRKSGKNFKLDDGKSRTEKYNVEREFIKTLPDEYKKHLVQLAIDPDYQPLDNNLPKLDLSWKEGLQANARVRLQNLMQRLGKQLPYYGGEEDDGQFSCMLNLGINPIVTSGRTKADAVERAADIAYNKMQRKILLSKRMANIPRDAANELNTGNPIASLEAFCKKYALEMPHYSEEKNKENGIYYIVSAPWLCVPIKGSSKATADLAKFEAAKRVICLIKHFSTKEMEPKKLEMINYCKKQSDAKGALIHLCRCLDLEKPSFSTYYCHGLVTQPLQIQSIITMTDKKSHDKTITGQKALSAALAEKNVATTALQRMINKTLKQEVQSNGNTVEGNRLVS